MSSHYSTSRSGRAPSPSPGSHYSTVRSARAPSPSPGYAHSHARYEQPSPYTRSRGRSLERTSPQGLYTVTGNGRLSRSVERGSGHYAERGSGHYGSHHYPQGYGYASTSHSGHHRRSGSATRHSPTYVVAAPVASHVGSHHDHRGRRGSTGGYYIDARSSRHPKVEVMPDTRSHHRRSRSVDSRRSHKEHGSFGDKMRRLFGLAPSDDHRHHIVYADPGSGREVQTMGKRYKSKGIEYMDARSGREVDKRGRPIYTV